MIRRDAKAAARCIIHIYAAVLCHEKWHHYLEYNSWQWSAGSSLCIAYAAGMKYTKGDSRTDNIGPILSFIRRRFFSWKIMFPAPASLEKWIFESGQNVSFDVEDHLSERQKVERGEEQIQILERLSQSENLHIVASRGRNSIDIIQRDEALFIFQEIMSLKGLEYFPTSMTIERILGDSIH